jgi:hypothetical protein
MRWAVHATVVGVMAEFVHYIDQTRPNKTQNYSVIMTESKQTDFFFSHVIYIPCCTACKTEM